jgi:hypothetical protein
MLTHIRGLPWLRMTSKTKTIRNTRQRYYIHQILCRNPELEKRNTLIVLPLRDLRPMTPARHLKGLGFSSRVSCLRRIIGHSTAFLATLTPLSEAWICSKLAKIWDSIYHAIATCKIGHNSTSGLYSNLGETIRVYVA